MIKSTKKHRPSSHSNCIIYAGNEGESCKAQIAKYKDDLFYKDDIENSIKNVFAFEEIPEGFTIKEEDLEGDWLTRTEIDTFKDGIYPTPTEIDVWREMQKKNNNVKVKSSLGEPNRIVLMELLKNIAFRYNSKI